MNYIYFTSDVAWNLQVQLLQDMISGAKNISRNTFIRHVDRQRLRKIETYLGYEIHHRQGLMMASDPQVSYFKSKIKDKTVYYFVHSTTKYIFMKDDDITEILYQRPHEFFPNY